MNIKCVVACRNAEGTPDFYFCETVCSQIRYQAGQHYGMAEELAEAAGYERPFVVFDEYDGPTFLFEHFKCRAAAGPGNSLEEARQRMPGTGWTDETLLMLVCRFIDQKGLGQQLGEHLDECAAELDEAARAADGGDSIATVEDIERKGVHHVP